jgi:hypothetical protein
MRLPRSSTALVALTLGGLSVCLFLSLALAAPARPEPTPSVPIRANLPLAQRQELQRLDILEHLDFFGGRSPFQCVAPAPTAASDIDVNRSLFVHDLATLDPTGANLFSLKRTLGQIAKQVNDATGTSTATALSIFRQFWDTQNAAPGLVPTPTSPHCDDNGGLVNGFPSTCRTHEGQEAADVTEATMNEYLPIALVNRLDLAHEGWRNCGEYRIVYGKMHPPTERNFMIFEAVLPNPKPGCREACMDVARYWRDLSTIDSAATRAKKLSDFYYRTDPSTGNPITVAGLESFRPVVHVDHYSSKGVTSAYGSSGSGQIRTNEFLSVNPKAIPWLLAEYKTVIDCGAHPCRFDMVPTMVKVNPHGTLWNEDVANGASADPRAQAFQTGLLDPATISKLSAGALMDIGYPVDLAHDAAHSISIHLTTSTPFIDNYRDQFHAATGAAALFRNDLAAAAMGQSLTVDQLINRAITQSCAGCHKPGSFGLTAPNAIGPALTPTGTLVTSWPADAGFFHVDPTVGSPAELAVPAVFGSGAGHELSPALKDVFLPARKAFMLGQLNATACACRNRFRGLPDARARLGLKLQDEAAKAFQERADALREESLALRAKPHPTVAARRELDSKERALTADRDKVLIEKLTKAHLPVPSLTLKAEVLKLDAKTVPRTSPETERNARQKAVLEIVRQEPPRRTVTGSFAVH